jgi:CDP-6-deoxy-D-xylo-4-hexulose-3-dehydrase
MQNVGIFHERLRKYDDRISIMKVAEGGDCSWFALPMTVTASAGFSRDDLTAFLESRGVETRPVVAGNLAAHPASSNFPMLDFDRLPGAEFIHEAGLYLGVHPVEAEESVNRVCDLFDEFMLTH